MKKKTSFILALFILFFVLASCNVSETSSASQQQENKLNIVTSLFPHYDFAKQIAGENANLHLLLPPGVESHSYEPSPSDIIKIYEADIFLYTGEAMEHWAHKLLESIPAGSNVLVVDLSAGIGLVAEDGGLDPHIWTSPVNALKMAESILAALCAADVQNSDYYTKKFDTLAGDLRSLDSEFKSIMANSNKDTIYFGSRFALRYLCDEYSINVVSAYDNCSEETEPSVQDMANIIDAVKENNIEFIYYQELEDPKIAKTISDETGAKMLLFHSVHNVTTKEMNAGASYVSLMKQNLINLEKGVA